MKCLNCEKEFNAKRDSAKYCSTNCRVKAHNKRGVKTQKENVVQMQVVMNTILEMVGKLNYAPSTPESFNGGKNKIADEPPIWKDEPMFQIHSKQSLNNLPTFQDVLNKMATLQFADEKEEFAQKIQSYTHLSEKQIKLLLSSLWT